MPLDSVDEPKVQPFPHISIRLIAIIAVTFALYYARALFLPLTMGWLLALTLSPIVRMGQRWRIPNGVTASFLVFMISVLVVAGITVLAAPVTNWVNEAPHIGYQLREKVQTIRNSIAAVSRAGEEVQKIAEPKSPGVQEVTVKQPGVVTRAADSVLSIAASLVLTLALTFFLLVSRDLLYMKIIRILPTLGDRKRALRIATGIETEISRYLLFITLINTAIGVAVGSLSWVVGLPNPLLWGIVAAVLNYLPYVGAFVGIILIAIISIITFDNLGYAIVAPLGYLAVTIFEGQFITPAALGRRFELNTVAILVSIAFWGFVWGIVGVIIAVPLLIVIRVFCEHIEGLSKLSELLSGDNRLNEADEVDVDGGGMQGEARPN